MTTNTEPMELQPMLPASSSVQKASDSRIVEIEEGNSCCSRCLLTSCESVHLSDIVFILQEMQTPIINFTTKSEKLWENWA